MTQRKRTLGIITTIDPRLGPWDPNSVHSGITGSEEAVIYIANELAKLGYQVNVYGNPPQGSQYSLPDANPRYVNIKEARFTEKLDFAIGWRSPNLGANLKSIAHKAYLWPHDILPQEIPQFQIDAWDGVFWLSEWQRQQWMWMSRGFSKFPATIFGNGVDPEQFELIEERENPYSCIYGSNYARGLEILLEIWPTIKEEFPRATLDIYYGWQHWGCLAPQKEAVMRKQVVTLPDVKEHGLVGHRELNRAYARSSVWTYPCTQAETFCITALRAQLSGAVPVIIEGSALAETVRSGYICNRPEDYLDTFRRAMRDAEKITVDQRKKIGEFIHKEYTWKEIASKWKAVFES